MPQLLQSKGLWKMLAKAQPMFTRKIEIFSYRNKLDEAMGFIGLYVSDSLLFHIAECKNPKTSWDKLASLFGKVN
jgi:hypothetical protein